MADQLIKTTAVTGRRPLRFDSLDDILADVEKLAQACDIKALGNWTPGQTCEHLARVMNKSIDGFDSQMPWIMRTVLGFFFKKSFLRKPMPAGFKLPRRAAEELIAGEVSTAEGLERLRHALHRLQTEPKRVASPFMGKMSLEEWTQLHCRHSELHLSFLLPMS